MDEMRPSTVRKSSGQVFHCMVKEFEKQTIKLEPGAADPHVRNSARPRNITIPSGELLPLMSWIGNNASIFLDGALNNPDDESYFNHSRGSIETQSENMTQ